MPTMRVFVGTAAMAACLGLMPGLANASTRGPSPFCRAIHDITASDPFHGAENASDGSRFVPELRAAAAASSTPRRLKPAIRTLETVYQRLFGNAQGPSNPAADGVSREAVTSSTYAKTAAVWRYYYKACVAYD
jgi:hypothetical protein